MLGLVLLALLGGLGVAPHIAGLVAERRVRALVLALDAASGEHVTLRLERYVRGYGSADALLTLAVDVPGHRARYELPLRVGHGPLPIGDIVSGRSAFRLCAGFVHVASGAGRGPSGTLLLPLRGRVVLDLFGDARGELGVRPEDAGRMSAGAELSPVSITLRAREDALALDLRLEHARGGRGPLAGELGGLVLELRSGPAGASRRVELAQAQQGDAALRYGVEQLVFEGAEPAEGGRRLTLGAGRMHVDGREPLLRLREPSLVYEATTRGDRREGRLALAFAGLSGDLASLGRGTLALRFTAPASALDALAHAAGRALEAPSLEDERLIVRAGALLTAFFAGTEQEALEETATTLLSLLRSSPSASLELDLRTDAGAKVLVGSIGLAFEGERIAPSRDAWLAAKQALLLTLDVELSVELARALVRDEVARRMAGHASPEESARLEELVREVFDAALESGVLVAREGGAHHLEASIPLGARDHARFGERTLEALAETPFGLALRRASMPRVRLALEPVVATGDLTDAQLIVAVTARARELRLCAEAELLDAPLVLDGLLELRAIVAREGTLLALHFATNSLADESFTACVEGVLRTITLPATRRGGSALVPLRITRGVAEPSTDALADEPSAP